MQKLAALVLLLLAGCGGQELPYVARGVWGEVSMTGEFCAWRYAPAPSPDGNGTLPFGGGTEVFPANGDFMSDYSLSHAGLKLKCVKDGPAWFYQVWRNAEPNQPSVYAIFDGVHGLWDERISGPVNVRAVITDHTGPRCANGLPCGAEGGDPGRFTFRLNGRDVPITTIVEIAGFPGHMYRGAFDMFGEFYELPQSADPATLSWQINSMGRFDWQQDTLPERPQ